MSDNFQVGERQDHNLIGNEDCNEAQHNWEVVQVQDGQVKGWALRCEHYATKDKVEHRKRERGGDDGWVLPIGLRNLTNWQGCQKVKSVSGAAHTFVGRGYLGNDDVSHQEEIHTQVRPEVDVANIPSKDRVREEIELYLNEWVRSQDHESFWSVCKIFVSPEDKDTDDSKGNHWSYEKSHKRLEIGQKLDYHLILVARLRQVL